jgi:formylmethanofuran dehydrogenase subunit B
MAAKIAFPVAQYGLQSGGGAHRMDDVPLPLRPTFATKLPAAETVLKALIAALGN